MRWEDERYVRFYTRDTPEWLALSWKARGLCGLLLRAVDRAGILKVGKLGLKGAAVAIHAPWVEIEEPLKELLADGMLAYHEEQGRFLFPNFLQAQECAQTDAARKRASRERARAEFNGSTAASIAAKQALNVTERDHLESHNVTKCHNESRAVTDGHSVPSLAVPNYKDHDLLSDRMGVLDKNLKNISMSSSKTELDLLPVALGKKEDKQAQEVFEHWRIRCRPKAVFTQKRKKLLGERRKEGFEFETLKAAIDGCLLSPFHRGENDRDTAYDNFELIFRDAKHVEDFNAYADEEKRKQAIRNVSRKAEEEAITRRAAVDSRITGPNPIQQVERG